VADRKRGPVALWVVPLMVGFAGFYRVEQSPNFAAYRAVDIVQLLGSGACIGAALVGVVFMLRGTRA